MGLVSCGHQQTLKEEHQSKTMPESSISTVTNYSDEFFKYFQQNKLTLKGDSIVIPGEVDSTIVLIPRYIPQNRNVIFESDNGNSITLRQINYTDIVFIIQSDSQKFHGKASLSPNFYLGMETTAFSDGEYLITYYYVIETDNPCLDFIGLGNQNIAEEKREYVYAMLSVSGDSCENELNELTNKKLKPFVSKTQKEISPSRPK